PAPPLATLPALASSCVGRRHRDPHSVPTRRSSDLERMAEVRLAVRVVDGGRKVELRHPLRPSAAPARPPGRRRPRCAARPATPGDRKSTRLNSSHERTSYAVLSLQYTKTTASTARA